MWAWFNNFFGFHKEEKEEKMLALSADIMMKACNFWPGMRLYEGLWIADVEYYLPERKEIEIALRHNQTNFRKFIDELWDCDDFALLLNAQIKVQRAEKAREGQILQDEWFPWAFGECWGTKFQGKKYKHAINICFTRDEGILLIEPQTDEIWKANPKRDQVYFIKI